MPLTIRCPKCGKELVAPDELLGKVAACPQCNLTFPVTGSARNSAPPMLIPVGPPPVPEPAPSGRSSTPPGGSSTLMSSVIPTNLPPTSSTQSTATFKLPAEGRGSASLSESTVANLRAEPRPPKSATIQPPPATPPTAASSGPTQREAKPARFITANPTERRIDLGADGRLPELILQEGTKSEQTPSAERTSNPLVLIAVLTVSFGLSAAMLFVETGVRHTESQRQAIARDELAQHYTQSARRLEPYQELLRQALQLHNQGKYADERACYRRVLDLLHEEHRENLKGLTGVRRGASPPSDEHLESLLSQLLSNE